MNRPQKYEELMAHKLSATPVPNADANWQKMRELLDKQQPATRMMAWKWKSVVAIVCTVVLWWLAENDRMNNTTANTTKSTPVTYHPLKNSEANPTKNASSHNNDKKEIAYLPSFINTAKKLSFFSTIPTPANATGIKNVAGSTGHPNNFTPILTSVNRENRLMVEAFKLPQTSNNFSSAFGTKKNRPVISNIEKIENASAIHPPTAFVQNWLQSLSAANITTHTLAALTSITLEDEKEKELSQQLAATAILQQQKIKALLAAEKWAKKVARRDRRVGALSGIFKPFSLQPNDGDPWWAVGLSVSNAVTTSNQNRVDYNINAKNNMALDFLPSPYVQYHINSNVYLQTELGLNAPQHTPQILIAQNSLQQQGSTLQRSIFIQKLYYFNVPVSLHYSPIAHLYIGGGLQFSSLQSGIALVQDRLPSNNNLVKNTVAKFKDDSTAARLNPNEWRWQTAADYYWNRFTVGARYNRSFNKLVNSQSFSPLKYNNNSFLFFIKYNLFEGRKKESQ
jgi:hypothetical protein